MSLQFSASVSRSGGSPPSEVVTEGEDDESVSSVSLRTSKLETLKRVLPKAEGPVSAKLGKILHSKHATKRRDFTSGPKDIKSKTIKEESPYKYSRNLAEFGEKIMNNAWREDYRVKSLQKTIHEKKSAWGKQNERQLERLWVDDTVQDNRLFVQDLDPEYLTTIEGRPIGDTDNVLVYMENIRDILRKKLMIAYQDDAILLIDAQNHTEQKMVEIIRNNYFKYVKLFEDFLGQDHRSATALLKESNQIADELYQLNKEYNKTKKSLKGKE